ncbi:MAG: hypothetical protein K2K34_08960, partial [Oscillospiraceae bacterium]|nr:hypothetical protein [Oscillospiraceae bacterium]
MTIKKTRGSISRIAAAAAAAVMALTAIPAIPALAAINLKNLPVPIAEDRDCAEARAFYRIVPELKRISDGSSMTGLSWSYVDGALYYKVYRKDNGGTYKCIANVFDTSYYDYEVYADREYKIQAVTFTYCDEKIFTKDSNIVKSSAVKRYYYGGDVSSDAGVADDDEDLYEESSDAAYAPAPVPAPAAVTTNEAYAPIADYIPANTEEYSRS